MLFWQSKVKGSSMVQFGFGPNASTVTVYDPLSQRQAHTGAFKFIPSM
jgi:hypothetical protein